jgi:hypothetical protein
LCLILQRRRSVPQEFYEKHKKVHDLKKQHRCHICGFVYGAAKGLEGHLKSHEEENDREEEDGYVKACLRSVYTNVIFSVGCDSRIRHRTKDRKIPIFCALLDAAVASDTENHCLCKQTINSSNVMGATSIDRPPID